MQQKKILVEDDRNGIWHQMKLTLVEDDFVMEDDFNGKWFVWKTTSMTDNITTSMKDVN